MEFTIETTVESDCLVIQPRGELDLGTQGELKRAVENLIVHGQVHLVMDLDGVSFIDSTGLGVLIGARRKTHAMGGSFVIRCRNEDVLRLFRVTSLDRIFTIRSS